MVASVRTFVAAAFSTGALPLAFVTLLALAEAFSVVVATTIVATTFAPGLVA